jgi:glycosyltransferase involved in cell wall biosynthesis
VRIAWFGEAKDGGGVPGMGALLLEGLLDLGVDVDFYTTDTTDDLPVGVRNRSNIRLVRTDRRWEWGRWYSRKPYRAFISGTIARIRAYERLTKMLIERNARHRYDCIFQLSQTELFKLGKVFRDLPPIIVYPCVHAAGELTWHRRESRYALESENALLHYLTRLILSYRSARQRKDVQKPALMMGMSRRFNELTARDYGLNPAHQAVLYHPIRTATPDAPPLADRPGDGIIRMLYVSRISVRKGVEQIIELSRRLDDLAGKVQIDVIGDRTQWSDYRAHLKELNPRTARALGGLPHGATMAEYEKSDILLLPSMYEPGGLVVGEALSRGLCAVVSDEVGSAEPVDDRVCRKFPAGDLDAFEGATRTLVTDLQSRRKELRETARAQAIEHFAPDKIARQLLGLITRVVEEATSEKQPLELADSPK